MSATPPPGYGYYAASWTISGSLRSVVTTWPFKNNVGATAAGINALMSTTILFQAGGLLDMTTCETNCTRVNGYTLINVGGVLQSASTNYATVGTGGNAAPSQNVSLVLNRNTAVAGRSGRGHMALPAGYLDEAQINTSGHYATTPLAAINTRLQTSYNQSTTSGLPCYLLHVNGATPTLITSMVANALVGTQRHRIKR